MAGTAARTDTGAGTGVCDICFSALRCDVSAFNKDGSKTGYRICNPSIIAVQPETVAADSGGSAEITSCTGKNTMPFVRIGTAFFTVAPTGSQCALPGDSQRAFFGNVNARKSGSAVYGIVSFSNQGYFSLGNTDSGRSIFNGYSTEVDHSIMKR